MPGTVIRSFYIVSCLDYDNGEIGPILLLLQMRILRLKYIKHLCERKHFGEDSKYPRSYDGWELRIQRNGCLG